MKIDGKRIDICEIEEALRHTSGISDAFVVATRNSDGTMANSPIAMRRAIRDSGWALSFSSFQALAFALS